MLLVRTRPPWQLRQQSPTRSELVAFPLADPLPVYTESLEKSNIVDTVYRPMFNWFAFDRQATLLEKLNCRSLVPNKLRAEWNLLMLWNALKMPLLGCTIIVAAASGCGNRSSSAPPRSYSISDLVSVVIETQEQIAEGKVPRNTAEIERCADVFAKSVAGTAYEAEAKAVLGLVADFKAAVAKGGNKQALGSAIFELANKVSAVQRELDKR